MHRTTTTLIVAATALLLLAPAAAAQSIEIATGPATAPEYPMQVEVDSFDLVDYADRNSNNEGEGHIHYLVNGEPATDDLSYATTSTTFTYEDLGVGDTVSAQLVNNDHSPIEPTAKATQEVGAGTPGFALPATLAAVGVAVVLIRRYD